MKSSVPSREFFVSFRGYRVWCRIVGEGEEKGKAPLLCLHGGPGAPHDYLEPLEAMAETGRRVIFYDQLGCGNSDRPRNPSLWTVELFLEELGTVRRELGLNQVHILGQSWGGMLAMEYALTRPSGIVSLILADSPASMIQWVSEANRLRSELPPDVRQTLLRHETEGTVDSPEYEEAMMVFYRRHLCRLDPWPDCISRTFAKMGAEVYRTMNGPSEFHVTGSLRKWDISERLGEINLPVLVVSGRYDEATPAISDTVHRGIRGSDLVIFENSAHMPHIEEEDLFLQTTGNFLNRVEMQLS